MITAGDNILVPRVALCYCTAGADILAASTEQGHGQGSTNITYSHEAKIIPTSLGTL